MVGTKTGGVDLTQLMYPGLIAKGHLRLFDTLPISVAATTFTRMAWGVSTVRNVRWTTTTHLIEGRAQRSIGWSRPEDPTCRPVAPSSRVNR